MNPKRVADMGVGVSAVLIAIRNYINSLSSSKVNHIL